MKPEQLADGIWLYEGDCLEVLPMLEKGSVDAVVTDPPYGTNVTEWDHSVDGKVFRECLRVSRGYCVFFYSNTRLWHILAEIKAVGADSWVMAWHKPNAMGFERKFAPQWVPIVCVYHSKLKFWGQDLFTCPVVPQDIGHPTPKPVKVVRWLINKATGQGGTILDPFAGSGTTAIAAMKEDRKCILIEKDQRYCEIIRRRVHEADGRSPGTLFAPTARSLFDEAAG